MKRSHEEDVRRVEEALIAAHRVQQSVGVDPAFQRDVMRHIRGLAVPVAEEGQSASAWLGPVWRFAAVTCVICLLLFCYSLNTENNLEIEVAGAISGAPSDLVIAQAFEDM